LITKLPSNRGSLMSPFQPTVVPRFLEVDAHDDAEIGGNFVR
jgi:hypothetical protein